jgi:hypothetical protein
MGVRSPARQLCGAIVPGRPKMLDSRAMSRATARELRVAREQMGGTARGTTCHLCWTKEGYRHSCRAWRAPARLDTFPLPSETRVETVAAARFVSSRRADEDTLAARDEPLRVIGGSAAHHADRERLGDVFRDRLRSGKFYKLGRTNAAGRRLRELAIQLPQKPDTVHVIETDDRKGSRTIGTVVLPRSGRAASGSRSLLTTCGRSRGADSSERSPV